MKTFNVSEYLHKLELRYNVPRYYAHACITSCFWSTQCRFM